MNPRTRLNQLVVGMLSKGEPPTARQLYEELRIEQPRIIVEEHVKGFKSFVKIINSFETVKVIGIRTRRYTVQKL
jgi:hypothetical protein